MKTSKRLRHVADLVGAVGEGYRCRKVAPGQVGHGARNAADRRDQALLQSDHGRNEKGQHDARHRPDRDRDNHVALGRIGFRFRNEPVRALHGLVDPRAVVLVGLSELRIRGASPIQIAARKRRKERVLGDLQSRLAGSSPPPSASTDGRVEVLIEPVSMARIVVLAQNLEPLAACVDRFRIGERQRHFEIRNSRMYSGGGRMSATRSLPRTICR